MIIWDLISRLTATGLASRGVIDRIYQRYGRQYSVTDIMKAVQEDKKQNYVPPVLRI